jgi:hypothetical protein
MVKRQRNKNLILLDNQTYVLDRVRVCINKKGEVVITSTTKTVIQEEIDDSFTIQSLEMSQRHNDIEEFQRMEDEEAYYQEEEAKNEAQGKRSNNKESPL